MKYASVLTVLLTLTACSSSPKVTVMEAVTVDENGNEVKIPGMKAMIVDTGLRKEGGQIVKEVSYVMTDKKGNPKKFIKGGSHAGYGTLQTVLPTVIKGATSIITTDIAAHAKPTYTHDGDSTTVFAIEGGDAGAFANQNTGVGIGVTTGAPCTTCGYEVLE